MDGIRYQVHGELAKVVEAVRENRVQYLISEQGETQAVVLSAEQYQTVMDILHALTRLTPVQMEVLEILADPQMMSQLEKSLADANAGRTVPLQALVEED